MLDELFKDPRGNDMDGFVRVSKGFGKRSPDRGIVGIANEQGRRRATVDRVPVRP
jgi:hypothetical protein